MIDGLTTFYKNLGSKSKCPASGRRVEWFCCTEVGKKVRKKLENYRPVALMDSVSTVFCRILNERLRECYEIKPSD